VVIDPRRVHNTNRVPPPVWIETVEADGQVMPLSETGRLPAGTRRVEIRYTALSLVAPEKVRFRHRLSGFDAQWVDGGTQRRISYTNLRPGTYTFQVVASNNDGVWNDEGQHWTFTVLPFFYQTTWFYGAIAFLAVGVGLALHSLRVRDLRLRNSVFAERAHLSQEIHDHVSQIMTGVVLQLDAASQTVARGDGSCGAYIDRASRLARQGIEETRVILRSLREGALPRTPAPTPLDAAVLESVAPLVEGTGARLQARSRGKRFAVSPAVEHALFRVSQEAVTNALRHGHARTIQLVVTFERHGVRLAIEDDGRGFEPSAVAPDSLKGLGLAGMAERVAEHRGTLNVRSRRGGGTTITVFFPRDACAGDS
jgi:signal transduction histidine kinase